MYLNYPIIAKVLGAIIIILGAAMIPSVIASVVYGETSALNAFAVPCVFLLTSGTVITLRTRPHSITLRLREGYLIVALCWLCASFFGAIPYLLSGFTGSMADAFFESVSGFTTTGCTVFDVLDIPKSLILWKAVSHLLGGMGILVFAISILPALGVSGQKIIKAETPGPTVDKVATRISDSAKVLYITYLVFGVIEFIMLSFSPMPMFDAIVHTFGSISTSGLSNHPGGIGHYDSYYVESVVSAFTILASINFALYAHALQGKWKDFFSNAELRAYIVIMLIASVLVSLALFLPGTYESLFEALRFGIFQVISLVSTSGYVVTDFANWPHFCKAVLFALMFVGGCAASTCGSIKVIRILVLFKLISRGIKMRIHKRAIVAVKLGSNPMPAETVSNITSFILTYLAIFFFSNIILSLQDLDFITTVSTSASMLANIGCNLGAGSPANDYSMFAAPLKVYLSFLMIVGRLELFTIIILLSPKFWNPGR